MVNGQATQNPVGASSLAMVVNDNAGWQVPRGALGFIASRLAPTKEQRPRNPVGASSLAMVVNDNAGWQVPRGALGFIASKLAPTVNQGVRGDRGTAPALRD
ncbi:hypothetical protein QF012_002950 [Pseudomonas laurylsulfatiphila]